MVHDFPRSPGSSPSSPSTPLSLQSPLNPLTCPCLLCQGWRQKNADALARALCPHLDSPLATTALQGIGQSLHQSRSREPGS